MKPFLLFFLSLTLITHAEAPPDLPLPVASFGAAAMENGSVFIYGGHSGTRHRYNRDDVHGDLYHWSEGMTAWEALPKDEPSQGASLLPTEKGVLRIGGMAARNGKEEKSDLWSSETAALYLTAEKKWQPLPNMPHRRSSHDSILVGKTLYVIGGWAMLGGRSTEWHDTYLTLNLEHPDAGWQTHPQPFERRALAVQALDSRVYAIGGMDSDDEITSAVSVLDTQTGKWSEGPSLPKDKLGGFGFAAITHEGRLFASGAAGVLLELRNDQWVPIAKLQHPRFFHRLVSGGLGKIIALGAESKDGKKTSPEVIDLPAQDSAPLNLDEEKSAAVKSSTPAALSWPNDLPPAESDWSHYQGPRGDCTTPEVGWKKDWPADGPPVLWKAELGIGLASFAIAGKRAFSSGNDGADQDTLWCLDLDTGKTLWKHRYPVPTKCHEMSIVPYGPAATPTVIGDKAWFISRDGDVLCVHADTGAVIWQKHLVKDLGGKRPVYGYSSSPFISKDRLFLDAGAGTAGQSNACLNALTGEVIWQSGDGEAGYATPFLTQHDGKECLVLFKGEALEIRSAMDGQLIARHATQTRDFCNCATPVLSGDTLFISHTGNMGARALQWQDQSLTERWSDRDIGLLFHSGLPAQGRLLAFNDQVRGSNDLRLLDLSTGTTLWKNTDIEKGTGLLCDDGHALLLTNKGELVLGQVLADHFEILQRVQVLGGKCWVQPALAHRRLICKNNGGSVVCLDLSH